MTAPIEYDARRVHTFTSFTTNIVTREETVWRRDPVTRKYGDHKTTLLTAVEFIALKQRYRTDRDEWDETIVITMGRYTQAGQRHLRQPVTRLDVDRDQLPEWLTGSERRFIEERPLPTTTLRLVEVAA